MKKKRPKLYPHQQEALERVLKEPFFALLMKQGTGKTAVAIRAIEERFKAGLINRVVVYCPKTLTYNWQEELQDFLGLPKSQYIIERLNQSTKAKQLQAYGEFIKQDPELATLKDLKVLGYTGTKKSIVSNAPRKLLILLLNYEKSRVMYKQLKKFKPHFLVVDESHKLKSQKAAMSSSIYKLTRSCKYRIILTGTLVCNGYEDIFMQYKIMNPDIFGIHFKEFNQTFIRRGGYMGKQIVGYKRINKLKRIIRRTSYTVEIEDCIKLPPISYTVLTTELESKAQKAYREMEDSMLTHIEKLSEDVSRGYLKETCKKFGIVYSPSESYRSLLLKAINYINTSSCDLVITQTLRLQQIAGGFLTLDTGQVVEVDQGKLNLVKDIVEEATKPVVIFCQYVAEINRLKEKLPSLVKRSINVREFRTVKDRDKVYQEFQRGEVDVLILQLKSGSVGLNLQKANQVVFYSMNFSSDDYVQAIARIKRNGQTNPMSVIHLFALNTVDLDIYEAIKSKRKLSDQLFTV